MRLIRMLSVGSFKTLSSPRLHGDRPMFGDWRRRNSWDLKEIFLAPINGVPKSVYVWAGFWRMDGRKFFLRSFLGDELLGRNTSPSGVGFFVLRYFSFAAQSFDLENSGCHLCVGGGISFGIHEILYAYYFAPLANKKWFYYIHSRDGKPIVEESLNGTNDNMSFGSR